MYSLEAKIRTDIAKVARANGVIPAVIYGKDTPSTMVAVGISDFTRLYRQAGQNHIIELSVDKKKYNVLVHDAQRHPVTGAFLHLDFLTVDMNAQIEVEIKINLVGTSPAVIEGGQLHQILETLTVKCLPTDIVDSFDLDISTLAMGHSLHVSDIKLDTKKFEVMNHAEDAVVSAHAPKKHAEETEQTSVSDVAVATEKKEEAPAE